MSDKPTPVSRARELRREMTEAEKLIWHKLRNRQFLNLKFLRQHPFIYQVIDNTPRYFISDFYCAEKKLIIEVDGKIHDFQSDDDQHREDILKSLGLKILRIKNEEMEDIVKVLANIKEFIVKIEMENKLPDSPQSFRRNDSPLSMCREGRSPKLGLGVSKEKEKKNPDSPPSPLFWK